VDAQEQEALKELEDLQAEFARSVAKQVNLVMGQNVARERKAQNLMQAQLGLRVGTFLGQGWTNQTVSAIEHGKRELSPAELLAVASVLGVPAAHLLLWPEGESLVVYEDDPLEAAAINALVLGSPDAPPPAVQQPTPTEHQLTPEELRARLKKYIPALQRRATGGKVKQAPLPRTTKARKPPAKTKGA
jgi:transcriptional regulator with XRE-family HTH domain